MKIKLFKNNIYIISSQLLRLKINLINIPVRLRENMKNMSQIFSDYFWYCIYLA